MPEEADITVEKKPRAPKAPKAETVAPEVVPEPVAEATVPAEAEPELVSAEPLAVDPETGETPEELKPEEPEEDEAEAPEPVPYRPMVTGAKWRGFTAERRARRKGIVL